ncbi:hypothetical protein JRQ81_003446, partial [Phrynocephalus forsythii]
FQCCEKRRAAFWAVGSLICNAIFIITIAALSAVLISERGRETQLYSPTAPVYSCPEDWIGYRRRCYYFADAEGDWESSRKNCSAFNASLVVIDSQEEMAFLRRYKTPADHWIGLQRNEKTDPWRWIDNTVFNNTFPIRGSGMCAYMYHEGIASSSCGREEPWICSKPPASHQRAGDTGCPIASQRLQYHRSPNRHSFRFHELGTWRGTKWSNIEKLWPKLLAIWANKDQLPDCRGALQFATIYLRLRRDCQGSSGDTKIYNNSFRASTFREPSPHCGDPAEEILQNPRQKTYFVNEENCYISHEQLRIQYISLNFQGAGPGRDLGLRHQAAVRLQGHQVRQQGDEEDDRQEDDQKGHPAVNNADDGDELQAAGGEQDVPHGMDIMQGAITRAELANVIALVQDLAERVCTSELPLCNLCGSMEDEDGYMALSIRSKRRTPRVASPARNQGDPQCFRRYQVAVWAACFVIALLVAVVIALVNSTCRLCPGHWNFHRDKCYWKSQHVKTWNQSRDDCLRKNAELLVIQDKEEMKVSAASILTKLETKAKLTL